MGCEIVKFYNKHENNKKFTLETSLPCDIRVHAYWVGMSKMYYAIAHTLLHANIPNPSLCLPPDYGI